MVTVAVVGARGYVGSHICRAVADTGRLQALPVVRGDDPASGFARADIIVHAANPAGRYQAERDPLRDFQETVEKTANLLAAAGDRRFVLVSSLSCRTQLDRVYGRHRRACELLALSRGALVIRLGPLFGGDRTQDTLHDILANRPVFVAAGTRYAYADVAWVAKRIVEMSETRDRGICEVGARNAVCLAEIRDQYGSLSTFEGPDDTQIPEQAPDGPDARDVFVFAQRESARRSEWDVEAAETRPPAIQSPARTRAQNPESAAPITPDAGR